MKSNEPIPKRVLLAAIAVVSIISLSISSTSNAALIDNDVKLSANVEIEVDASVDLNRIVLAET